MGKLDEPIASAKKLILKREAMRLKPYTDTTGHLTIGVGRNLTDRGISESEALHLFANDLMYFYKELERVLPWFKRLDDVRQLALVSMAFNLGVEGLLKFQRMLRALAYKRWSTASDEALDSLWARQVGFRAEEVALMFKLGEFPHGYD